MDWLNYIIIIIITAVMTVVLTENAISKRIQYSEGIVFSAGKCRLAQGYGKVGGIGGVESKIETTDVPVSQFKFKVV